jgi:hypothetical protein
MFSFLSKKAVAESLNVLNDLSGASLVKSTRFQSFKSFFSKFLNGKKKLASESSPIEESLVSTEKPAQVEKQVDLFVVSLSQSHMWSCIHSDIKIIVSVPESLKKFVSSVTDVKDVSEVEPVVPLKDIYDSIEKELPAQVPVSEQTSPEPENTPAPVE